MLPGAELDLLGRDLSTLISSTGWCFVHFKTYTVQSAEYTVEGISCRGGDPYVCKCVHEKQ